MEFNDKYSIYLQIADHVNDHILLGDWKPDDRIPSVRELAMTLQVNPNTVMRAYDYLQQKGILYNRRGLGIFVAPDSGERILAYRREQFLNTELPPVLRTMYTLGISFRELENIYKRYIRDNFNSKHSGS